MVGLAVLNMLKISVKTDVKSWEAGWVCGLFIHFIVMRKFISITASFAATNATFGPNF